MKTVVGMLLAYVVSVPMLAQGDYTFRASGQADRLKWAASRLADRTRQDLLRAGMNSRADIQTAALAQQVDAVAALCQEMIRNRRPVGEVRALVAELDGLTRRAPSYAATSLMWRDVQAEVEALDRILGGSFGPGPDLVRPKPIVGRVSWVGRVDDRVQLAIRGSMIETRTVAGSPLPEGRYIFTSPLPASSVEVSVTKTSGRGQVRVLQQPARNNDFTAVVEIYDEKAGAQEYRLDIVWR